MDIQWVVGISISFVVAFGGVWGLRRFWNRPRLYYRSHTNDFVSWMVLGERRRRAEQLLEDEGLPTAVCHVNWWNAGRTAADDLVIDVETPGEVVELVSDPGRDDVGGPYRITKHPKHEAPHHHFRLEQTDLKPNSDFYISLGFQRKEAGEAKVRVYADGKEVMRYSESKRPLMLRSVPVLVMFVVLVVILTFALPSETDLAWPVGLLVGIGVMGVGVLQAPVILKAVRWWDDWVDRHEHVTS